MRPFPNKSSTFGERALINHLLFCSMAIVVLIWSFLSGAESSTVRLTRESFETLVRFIDFKQVGIPVAGCFLLYLFISILSHQSRSTHTEQTTHQLHELLHGEISSILMNSASLSFAVGMLFFFSGLWPEGLKTVSWWPMGFFLSYVLRPKSQDRFPY
jgi:hypothetical protein